MSQYQPGTAINLVQNFWTIDPLTEAQTPADPDDVTFEIQAPDGTLTSYVFGADMNITNPSVGTFLCKLTPPAEAGVYGYRVIGSGTVDATDQGTFEVLSESFTPDYPIVATPSVCSGWITGEDVAACTPGVEAWMLDDLAATASLLMFELSGRQFPGICQRTVRPCRQACACFGFSPSLGLGNWFWTSAGVIAGEWRNECGDKCGCGSDSYVKLAGYPVREILEVKLNGDVLDPSQYRLDGRRYLLRTADAVNPQQPTWPICQNLRLADDQPLTFSVKYTWGTAPPQLGKLAAAQLACEFWKAQQTGACALPSKVTKIVRQNLTIDRLATTAALLRAGGTGVPFVDAFIAQVNPHGLTRKPAVWSPDSQKFARKVGQ